MDLALKMCCIKINLKNWLKLTKIDCYSPIDEEKKEGRSHALFALICPTSEALLVNIYRVNKCIIHMNKIISR